MAIVCGEWAGGIVATYIRYNINLDLQVWKVSINTIEGGCMKKYRVEKESGGLAAQIERLQREIAELREAAQTVADMPNRETIARLRNIL